MFIYSNTRILFLIFNLWNRYMYLYKYFETKVRLTGLVTTIPLHRTKQEQFGMAKVASTTTNPMELCACVQSQFLACVPPQPEEWSFHFFIILHPSWSWQIHQHSFHLLGTSTTYNTIQYNTIQYKQYNNNYSVTQYINPHYNYWMIKSMHTH